MSEILKSIFEFLINNYALYLVITMGIIISITITLLNLIKKPIKKLTSKIQNEKYRKLANKMFIVFAFGFAALFWAILSFVSSCYFAFDIIEVFLTGALAIVLYAFGDGVINTKNAKDLVEAVKEITEDKKIDENDTDLLKDCLRTINKVE